MESGSLLWKSMSENNQLLHIDLPHSELTSRIQHFVTRRGNHERRRLLRLYLSDSTIDIVWTFDKMTARRYLQLMVSHLHVVQLWDRFPGNTHQNRCHLLQRQADSLSLKRSQSFSEDKVVAWKPTECSSNKILKALLSKFKWSCSQNRTKNLILRRIRSEPPSVFWGFCARKSVLNIRKDDTDVKSGGKIHWDAGSGRTQPDLNVLKWMNETAPHSPIHSPMGAISSCPTAQTRRKWELNRQSFERRTTRFTHWATVVPNVVSHWFLCKDAPHFHQM